MTEHRIGFIGEDGYDELILPLKGRLDALSGFVRPYRYAGKRVGPFSLGVSWRHTFPHATRRPHGMVSWSGRFAEVGMLGVTVGFSWGERAHR